jgi:hypothetical protein
MNNVKKLMIIIISFMILLFPIRYTTAQTFDNNEIIIECEPTSIHMDYGSEATININIHNVHNQTEYVYIEWIATEAFGLTRGELSEEYFNLEPGGTNDIKILLHSSNTAPQSDGAEDGIIWVRWGINLSLTSWGSVELDTVDNETMIHIDVIKFFTNPYCILGIIITGIIIAIIIVLFFKRKISKRLPDHSEQVGDGQRRNAGLGEDEGKKGHNSRI